MKRVLGALTLLLSLAACSGANDAASGVAASSGTGGNLMPGSGATANGGATATGGTTSGGTEPVSNVVLPTANAGFDYQIGGGYDPPENVTIVSRDRGDSPAPGLYNICYVNGFQAQQAENDFWLDRHPGLVLHDEQSAPVIDQEWQEMLLDTSSAEKRAELARIVGEWIRGCADAGFDAVEIDNLDTYSRSGGRLSKQNNVEFMSLLSSIGHQAGLAMGQKNSSEILDEKEAMGTDFAVVEECNRYDECGAYQAAYDNLVFIIEYRDQDFTKGCRSFPELSIVRRDVGVTTPGSGSYRYDGC